MSGKNKLKRAERNRLIVQAISFAFTNGYVNGWTHGRIYTGDNKKLCIPGLNCYSCPGAVASCPLGSLQAILGSSEYYFSLYVFGFIGMVGMLCGRFVCGFLCPFGFVQELLYKIPIFKKVKSLPGHKVLKYLKYVILLVFVIALPMFLVGSSGDGKPWFCEYICPSGTLLGGIVLAIANESVQDAIGWRFVLKMIILVLIMVGAIKFYRPFCKYLCPLGALYSLANPISLYRYKIDENKCTGCGACSRVCNMEIEPLKTPNSPECIRCGRCKNICPNGAIRSTLDELTCKVIREERE